MNTTPTVSLFIREMRDSSSVQLRLASQSGQSVTMVGGGVLIGDSDTSDEEDGEEGISKVDPCRGGRGL